jgi:predicted AAA+ superfamily ATPase
MFKVGSCRRDLKISVNARSRSPKFTCATVDCCTPLGIANQHDLEYHPKFGASWEVYAVEEVPKAMQSNEAYYWATYSGAEIDLVLFKCGRRIEFESKTADAPTITRSMHIALDNLILVNFWVVYRKKSVTGQPGSRGCVAGGDGECEMSFRLENGM